MRHTFPPHPLGKMTSLSSLPSIQQPQFSTDKPSPPRPPNAFILFSRSIRESVRLSNPGLNNIEYTKIMAEMWKTTSEVVKAHFREEAAQLQEDFKRKNPDYSYSRVRKMPKGMNSVEGSRPPKSIFPPTTWEIPWHQLAEGTTETSSERN
jgi:hypothetical protein